jgi:hypothetical protein
MTGLRAAVSVAEPEPEPLCDETPALTAPAPTMVLKMVRN